MKVQILSGVMIRGTAVFPKTGEGKNAVDSIVDVTKAEARDLVQAGQAKVAAKGAKINIEIKEPEAEADELDKFFGEDDEPEE
ncbi:hypothetical protein [Shewanella frigidimarina]|uniref:hypothetical protein n=1 Tax=Shewanella frigidimarina TaxID=56812 RepID=UPI003D7C0F08